MQFDIRRFDIYRKVPKDLTQPTFTGACISIMSCLFMVFLFYSELVSFITIDTVSEMFVEDPMTHSEKIPVKLDIELHKLKCELISLHVLRHFLTSQIKRTTRRCPICYQQPQALECWIYRVDICPCNTTPVCIYCA